jgi:hypothetical protein
LVFRATPVVEAVNRAESNTDSENASLPQLPASIARQRREPGAEVSAAELNRALRGLHLLLRSTRLYERHHPHTLQSLDSAYESLRTIAANLNGLEFRMERGGITAPKLNEAPLADAKGELQDLARDLQRAGIHTLFFARAFHVGELDTLAQLVKATLLNSEGTSKQETAAWWPKQLVENRVEGISVNTKPSGKSIRCWRA